MVRSQPRQTPPSAPRVPVENIQVRAEPGQPRTVSYGWCVMYVLYLYTAWKMNCQSIWRIFEFVQYMSEMSEQFLSDCLWLNVYNEE